MEDTNMTKRKLRIVFWIAAVVMMLFGSAATGASAKDERTAAEPPGGDVVPAGMIVNGYSLADAAVATAYFNTGSRAKNTLPENFPFQILYLKPNNNDTFNVDANMMYYVPVIYSDDLDAQYWKFPDVTDPAEVSAYYFNQGKLGADYVRIIVDGKMTELGPEYAVGAVTPGLPDGGNNYTVVAAFLTNLSKGTHTVGIEFLFSGNYILKVFGGPYYYSHTYTVIVR
jgi:hypothetical protein